MFHEILLVCSMTMCIEVIDDKMSVDGQDTKTKPQSFQHETLAECYTGLYTTMKIADMIFRSRGQIPDHAVPERRWRVEIMECSTDKKGQPT